MEPNQVGKRQDLSDYVVNIQRTATPLLTELPKDDVHKTNFETQVDDYGDTDDVSGVGSSEDADSFHNEVENRALIENTVMKMWENPGVDDFAENVNENPAVSSEYANAVKKAVVRLKFRIEKRLLSQMEGAKQDGTGAKYATCSIGGFLKSAAPTGTQVVPTRYRTPAAQLYTSTVALITEDAIHDILQEIFEATFGTGVFKGYLGSELKQKVSLMSIYRPDVASNTNMRKFDQSEGTTIETVVDVLVGDFGRVDLVPITRMRYFDGTGAATTTAQRRGSGYILDLEMWGLAFKRRPGHKPLQDKGGGPRGIVDTIFGLRCKNPVGNGAITVSG